MIQIVLAFIAGILTIAAPCILLPLPILLGSSIGHTSKTRPLFITLGFVLAFASLGIFLNFLVQHLGLSANALRNGAAFVLALFALFMIWPTPFERLMTHASGIINKASRAAQGTSRGNAGGLLLGVIIGIVWAPCAGPILGSILTLIARQSNSLTAAVLLIAYALGAGLPMLVIAYGGQYVTTKFTSVARYSKVIQQIFGVVILLVAVAIFFQYDTYIEAQLVNYVSYSGPQQSVSSDGATNLNSTMPYIGFQDYGLAPDFMGISHWLNSDPLTMEQLRGKVVLIDFWTYSCINCIRTLPYVTKWYDTYHDKGLVVIGVHSPEFAFEKDTNNVAAAIQRYNIHYPVAQDNDLGTWDAYNNQYWPAEYLIDQKGHIVLTHFGEGEYDKTEDAIRTLLGLNSPVAQDNGVDLSKVQSPEMYFGTDRLQNLSPQQAPKTIATDYTLPSQVALNTFALSGQWQFNKDNAMLVTGPGKIKLHFSSGKVNLVASADKPVTVNVIVDGKAVGQVVIQGSQLYTLFDSNNYTDHVLELDILNAGLQAYTFTYG